MRKYIVSLFLILLSSVSYATTSTINPAIPGASSALSSAPIRNNFAAAYNDINNIYATGLFTLPVPVLQGGTGVTLAQGNGSKVQLSTGSFSTNDCVKFDANGNTVTAGAPCGSGGGGGVTSVTFTGDGVLLSSTPSSPVTTTGTLAASLLTHTANTVLAGPATGSAAAPTFRALVAADLPNLTGDVTSSAGVTSVVAINGVPINGYRLVIASGAVTMTNADKIVELNKTTPAATVVNLPTSPNIGQVQTIKDGAGNASLFPITLTPATGLIDGLTTYIIATDYASVDFYWNGTAWRLK